MLAKRARRLGVVLSLVLYVTTGASPLRADAISVAAISAYTTLENTYNINLYLNDGNGATLGWGESYILMGADAMYEATGTTRYLQRTLDHADSVMANRADRLGVMDGVRNKLMPAWTSTKYTSGVPYAFEVHAGMVCAPIARAAYLVRKDPALTATYGTRVDRYIRDMTDMAIGFESDWRAGPKSNEGYYRELYLGTTSPYNQMNALGRMYVSLYSATGQQRFRERAEKLANFFKDDLKLVGDRYDWAYSTSSSGSEDISHAAINADFAFQCYRAGIVFNATDMQRFANTLLAVSRGADGATATVSGSGTLATTPGLLGMWGQLGYTSPAVRNELFKYFQNHSTAGGVSWGTSVAGYLAETAKPLVMETPLPQLDRKRTLIGFEHADAYLKPGTLGARGSGYSTAATAYDDTAGAAQQGSSSVKLTVFDLPATTGGWKAELPAGTNASGQKLVLDRAGWIGVWMKTLATGTNASLLVSDLDGLEETSKLALAADGAWHLYQWDMDNVAQWTSYSAGNGALDGLAVSLESILVSGPDASGAAVVFADNLMINESGAVPEVSGAFAAGLMVLFAMKRWRK